MKFSMTRQEKYDLIKL